MPKNTSEITTCINNLIKNQFAIALLALGIIAMALTAGILWIVLHQLGIVDGLHWDDSGRPAEPRSTTKEGPTSGQPALDAVSAWGGPVGAMQPNSNLAPVGNGRGLVALEIADLRPFIEIGAIDQGNTVEDLTVRDGDAYVATKAKVRTMLTPAEIAEMRAQALANSDRDGAAGRTLALLQYVEDPWTACGQTAILRTRCSRSDTMTSRSGGRARQRVEAGNQAISCVRLGLAHEVSVVRPGSPRTLGVEASCASNLPMIATTRSASFSGSSRRPGARCTAPPGYTKRSTWPTCTTTVITRDF